MMRYFFLKIQLKQLSRIKSEYSRKPVVLNITLLSILYKTYTPQLKLFFFFANDEGCQTLFSTVANIIFRFRIHEDYLF